MLVLFVNAYVNVSNIITIVMSISLFVLSFYFYMYHHVKSMYCGLNVHLIVDIMFIFILCRLLNVHVNVHVIYC